MQLSHVKSKLSTVPLSFEDKGMVSLDELGGQCTVLFPRGI